MEERNVLSSEEVEAILKASQSAGDEATMASHEDTAVSSINTHALGHIIATVCDELEKKLTVLLRKKAAVKSKPAVTSKMEECVKQANDRDTYSSYKLLPYASDCLISMEFTFIDQAINLLYGGKTIVGSDEIVSCGKIGGIAAEKIGSIVIESFAHAAKTHGEIQFEHHKTGQAINHVNHVQDNETVYVIEFSAAFEEIETKLCLYLTEEFLIKLLPVRTTTYHHQEKDFWRTAIKSEVIDSYVTITTTINDTQLKVKDFMNLKEGDLIPISDPTLVYVCLNNLKLFKAVAGQSNSKIVVKVVSQV